MEPQDIMYKIKCAGSSQTKIAEKVGVTQTAVWNVINGKSKSKAIEQAIAEVIGVPVSEIWPESVPEISKPSGDTRQILIDRLLDAADWARKLGFDPIELMRAALAELDRDAMIVVNKMPEVCDGTHGTDRANETTGE